MAGKPFSVHFYFSIRGFGYKIFLKDADFNKLALETFPPYYYSLLENKSKGWTGEGTSLSGRYAG